MRTLMLIISILVFVLLVAVSHKVFQMAPPDRFVTDINTSIEQQRDTFHDKQNELSLRINLLEYQNYLLLSIIGEAGMSEEIAKYGLSLYPPEPGESVDRPRFDCIYEQYRTGTFLELNKSASEQPKPRMFCNEARPPSVHHHKFRVHWRIVSSVQNDLADIYLK